MAEIPTSEDPTFAPPAGPPTAILAWSHSGGYLLGRQAQAVADYWNALAHAARPNQALCASLGLWSRMFDDYAAALSEAAAPFNARPASRPETLAAE
jgi:hypothetical protein